MDFGWYPVVGAELECYLVAEGDEARAASSLTEPVNALLQANGIATYEVIQERGPGQVEIIFREISDPVVLAKHITLAKELLAGFARERKLTLLTEAKPFEQHPGNGLHIHISLHDEQGRNVFFKRNEVISVPLKHALGGLLEALPESMLLFAPTAASYARFCGAKDAPTSVSWGSNNRTTALRLPESRDGLKHLEHRVPGADANPEQALLAVLAGVHYGLHHQSDPGTPVFGDAFATNYTLPLLPRSLEDASKAYAAGHVLPMYLG